MAAFEANVPSEPKRSSESIICEATCDFAVRVHKKLAAADGNVFFSPLSLSVAMSMLLRGTKEETAKQITEALGFDSSKTLSEGELHNGYGELISAAMEPKESYVLAVANALVSHKNFELLPDYREDLEKIYRASAWEMDLDKEAEKAVIDINEWIKSNTRGMIPKLLDHLDSSTVLVLLNAVYFKGTWENQFNPKRTRPVEFYNGGIDTAAKKVPMMYTKDHFLYMECSTYKALEMSYEGDDISMMVLLPHQRNGLAELEKNLSKDFLRSVREDSHNIKVKVTLPKLHLEYSKSMCKVFRELGMLDIFDHSRANFKGLSEIVGKLEVSEILHKAVIDVNEEGSEAAAVTGLMVGCARSMPKPEIEFVADHPFLFVIYNTRNGMIFFMGRVYEL